MVEQRTLNPSVQSSSLCAPTIFQPVASKGAAGYSFCGVRAQVNLGLLDSLLRFRAPSMHPRLLSAAFLAVFSLAVRAESPDEACLKEAASLLSPSQTVSAAFRMEKILPRMARPLPARGRVLVAPGEGLIWETTFPFKEMRVFGQKRWAATDANGALQVHDIRTDRFEALLGQSRGELLASLKRTFFVTCRAEGDTLSVILSPRPGTLADYLTEIAFQASAGKLTRSILTQTDGTVTHLEFTDTVTGSAVGKADAENLSRVK